MYIYVLTFASAAAFCFAFVVAPPHCFLLSWHASHACCNHTGPARDVSRQGGNAHKLSTDGSREIQRPRALCLCPVSRGVPHLQEIVTSILAVCAFTIPILAETSDASGAIYTCVINQQAQSVHP